MGEKEKNQELFRKNWTRFSESIPIFKKKTWKFGQLNHSIQRDSINCGVYVCKFFELLINKKPLQFDDSLNELKIYREKMNILFRNNSKTNYCSFCGDNLKKDDDILKNSCFHRYHSDCSLVKLKSKQNFICPICF